MILQKLKEIKFLNIIIIRILELFKIHSYISKLIYNLWNIKFYLKMISFYSRFIKRGDLCYDIGANIGEKTRIFLKLGATVVCVEPQKLCIKELHNNFRKNKKIKIVGQAVGAKEGHANLSICDEYHTLSTLSEKWKTKSIYSKKFTWSNTVSVKMTTLDSLIKSYGLPKFCKIDVEGYETEVIKGLTQKIPFISFEFHITFFNNIKKIIEHLLLLGATKFNFIIGEGIDFYFQRWISAEKLLEALNSIKNQHLWGDIFVKFD